ncbi:MAG TPA: hypothetical protein VN924_13155 [Bryobacteraceae bacterium]|jgi:uncharacterized protein (TIGR03437 family)|nr:hypothetical protein [Bryobacteraceae bacterium]
MSSWLSRRSELRARSQISAAIQALEDAAGDRMDIAAVAFGSLPLGGPLDTDCVQNGVPAQALVSTLAIPTVTIAAVAAQVLFSGLTPDSIGLYQIDIVVPLNAPPGVQPVVIAQNGVSSAPANLPIQ